MVGVFFAIILIFVMMGDSVKKAEKKAADERREAEKAAEAEHNRKMEEAVALWKKDYYERHPNAPMINIEKDRYEHTTEHDSYEHHI